jgi:hypothetical protein
MAESSPIRLNFVPVSTESFEIRSTLAKQAMQNSEICSCVTSAPQTLQETPQELLEKRPATIRALPRLSISSGDKGVDDVRVAGRNPEGAPAARRIEPH